MSHTVAFQEERWAGAEYSGAKESLGFRQVQEISSMSISPLHELSSPPASGKTFFLRSQHSQCVHTGESSQGQRGETTFPDLV